MAPVIREELGRSPGPHPVYWFEKDSGFRAELERQLSGHEFELRQFTWSGSNSFGARTFAAAALHDYLKPELARPDTHHVVIGHSHAGNVIFEALTRPDRLRDEGRIAGVLTLATPYLALETDTSDFNLVLHRLLPFILGGYVLGLMVVNAVLGHWDTLGWLLGSTVAYAAGMARLQQQSLWRWPRELLFWAAALVSAVCVGHAVLPWFATSYPADSFYAIAAKALAPPVALALGLTHLALLVAARAAGSTPSGTFLLRDLVRALAAVYACVVLVADSAWIVFQPTPAANWFLLWLCFWPVGALFVAQIGGGKDPGKAILNLWRAKEKELERFVLPCEFHAMRMAGDEATLAIVASQLVRALTSSPRKILDTMNSWSAPVAISIAATMLIFGVSIGYLQSGAVSSGGVRWVVGTVVGVGAMALLPIVAALLATAVTLLLATLSFGLVGLAVGTDVFELLPAVRVGCESLPRGPSEQLKLTLLWPDPEERKQLPLRHSMYDLPSVQARVAWWVNRAYRRV